MKTTLLIYILIFLCSVARPATIKWDGQGGDDQWSNQLNWDADRMPDPGDDVILDNTYITGSYTVSLPAGNVSISVLSLIIIPAASTITCILPPINTASPALTLTRTGDAFILHSGAVFRNASGAASGTPVTVNSAGIFRINNGGHYIHQTARGHTDFLVSRLSTAAGTEQGIFEFDVPGTAAYTISVSGRVFGKLVFSATSAGTVRTYTGAGINAVLIRGDLEIKTNAIFSYGSNTDTITVLGDALIRPGGVLNIANGSNSSVIRFNAALHNEGLITESGSSTDASLILNGIMPQQISCTGSITQQLKLLIDNPAGVTLLSPLLIGHGMEFIKGTLHTTATNLLSFGATAFYSGASAASFVQGPVKKKGTAAFDFPVGAGAIYAPVGISEGGELSDEFIAEYKRANPQSVPGLGNSCVSPVNHISYVEYWDLSQVAGNTPRQVKLNVSSFSFAYNLEALVVARSENGQWISEGGADHSAGTSEGSYVTGNFFSTTAVGGFGAFTLGSLINQQQNPLPLVLEYFKAKTLDGHIRLEWKIGNCNEEKPVSVLEYAGMDRQFHTLATLSGSDTDCVFAYKHDYAGRQPGYYRLRLLDISGRMIDEKILAAPAQYQGNNGNYFMRMLNNDKHQLEVLATMPAGRASLIIIDNVGRVLFRKDHLFSGSEEKLTLPFAGVSRGIYRLIAVSDASKIYVSFIR